MQSVRDTAVYKNPIPFERHPLAWDAVRAVLKHGKISVAISLHASNIKRVYLDKKNNNNKNKELR